MTLPAHTLVIAVVCEPRDAANLPIGFLLRHWIGSLSSAWGSYLHELVAFFASGDEVVAELVLRLQFLDDGELIQGLGLGTLDDCWGDQRAWLFQSHLIFFLPSLSPLLASKGGPHEPSFHFMFIYLFWCWGWNPGLPACYARALH